MEISISKKSQLGNRSNVYLNQIHPALDPNQTTTKPSIKKR